MFEELDHQQTPIGELSLRRRHEPRLDEEVYEIKLGDEFLMTSLFTESEVALARLALSSLDGESHDVLVGGLGLGYTASEVLSDDRVRSLTVIELLAPVIDWHRRGLLPLGTTLVDDPRCRLRRGDFFELSQTTDGFDERDPGHLYDAILVDIDHSPHERLDERSAGFYRPEGLTALSRHLRQGGLFGLWSNDAPDDAFTARIAEIFGQAWSEPVTFHNPLQDRPFTQTVYLARASR